ncbi:tyrosine kinase catalytic domain protein [Rhizoctonia solani AG-3 Rhs1AP]|uniref:Tyrosine kinase catalytic domain protein n=2 Tax=Rhizoctonia solani AG-3 TaxID=1086053 RepID=A0A074SLE9_9AGAM|nr:tyrosine kinase catalytic domain protein [Rhizoctonia solani AG-3 Rhs1AP]KEP50877.1 tyrosine kinase catalytic domain protein [Rhizoctonia solani 123E]
MGAIQVSISAITPGARHILYSTDDTSNPGIRADLTEIENHLRQAENLLLDNHPLIELERNAALHIQALDQTQDDATLNTPRFRVTPDTTIQDVVAHYEGHNLTNYTELLQTIDIAGADAEFQSGKSEVHQIRLPDQRDVAVKCVRHQDRYKRLKRATRELACWSFPRHSNILPVLGFAVVKGKLAMVSPWMKNRHITDYIENNPSVDRIELCVQLIGAIDYLHRNNMIHGDIKSPNVLISDEGNVQVTDFGVSIKEHREIEFSVSVGMQGTYQWMAPEIFCGGDSTKEADMYALGITLFEIITGGPPYGSSGWNPNLQGKITSEGVRPSRSIQFNSDETGNALWELIGRCWVHEPRDRLTSSQAFEWINHIRWTPFYID